MQNNDMVVLFASLTGYYEYAHELDRRFGISVLTNDMNLFRCDITSHQFFEKTTRVVVVFTKYDLFRRQLLTKPIDKHVTEKYHSDIAWADTPRAACMQLASLFLLRSLSSCRHKVSFLVTNLHAVEMVEPLIYDVFNTSSPSRQLEMV